VERVHAISNAGSDSHNRWRQLESPATYASIRVVLADIVKRYPVGSVPSIPSTKKSERAAEQLQVIMASRECRNNILWAKVVKPQNALQCRKDRKCAVPGPNNVQPVSAAFTMRESSTHLDSEYCIISFSSARGGTRDRLAKIRTSATLRMDRGNARILAKKKDSATCVDGVVRHGTELSPLCGFLRALSLNFRYSGTYLHLKNKIKKGKKGKKRKKKS